jgi:hypothetical protein
MKIIKIGFIVISVTMGIITINQSLARSIYFGSDLNLQLTPEGYKGEVYPPETIKDASGFAYIDAEGKIHEFSSVEEIESWVDENLDYSNDQDVAIFKQRIGNKDGLLVVVGSKEFIPVIKESVNNPVTIPLPTAEVLNSDEIIQSRQRSLELIKLGETIALDQLFELTTEFNKASSLGDNSDITEEVIGLMHELANMK